MAEEQILNTGIQFEDIVPWVNEQGDTGLTSRLKLKRNFDKIKAWMDAQGNAATQQWVDDNYLTKDFFSAIFQLQDSQGNAILPNTATEAKDRLKILVGAYTEQYLSALGLNDDQPACSSTLAGLLDVELSTPTNGQTLVYDAATHKWTNGTIQAGTDMATVWTALADTTTEQISATHLTTALSGYATQIWVQQQGYLTQHQSLSGYATQSWVNDNYVSISFFERLFNAYNGLTKVSPNSTATIDNIKAMFGFWTEQYISALGKGEDESHEIGVLNDLNDVTLTNPTANQVLSYNGTHWVNRSIELGSQTLADLTDVVITSPAANQMLSYDATTQKWKNIAIPATGVTSVALSMPTGFSITGSPITASGTFTVTFASGYSLPTTAKQANWDTAYGWGDHASAGYVKSSGVTSVATGTGLTGGTITGTGTISINSTYQTYISNGNTAYGWGNHANAGYLKVKTDGVLEIGQYIDFHKNDTTGDYSTRLEVDGNYGNSVKLPSSSGTLALTSDLDSYLPLSGGTMSGGLTFNLLNSNKTITFSYGEHLDNYGNIHLAANSESWNVLTSNGGVLLKLIHGTTYCGIGVSDPSEKLHVNGNIKTSTSDGTFVQIGNLRLVYDSANNAIKVVKSDGNAANFYATGGLSALGAGQESGGTNYLPLSGGTMSGTINITTSSRDIIRAVDSTYSKYVFATSASGGEYAAIHGFNHPTFYTTGGSLNLYGTNGVSIGNWEDPTVFISNDKSVTFKSTIKNESSVPFMFYGYGSELYTLGTLYCNSSGIVFETPRASNSVSATALGFHVMTRGAAYTTLYCLNVSQQSDVRLKDIHSYFELDIKKIANAPTFRYYWKSGVIKDLQIGTSAQYWESVLPEVVSQAKDEIGTLSMQYGVAALISVISVAKKVMTHEEKIALLETRVSALEKENGEQEQLINSLQEELANFKAA